MTVVTEIDLSDHPEYDGHEKIFKMEDKATGLLSFVAIHNSNLGPALGGCRYYTYTNEADAHSDVLRLSRGMTYKSALAGLPLGGGKSVIIAKPDKPKTSNMMEAFGEGLEKIGGLYVTAEDVGTTEEDMVSISKSTSYVSGLPPSETLPLSGNPSPLTALGVFSAVRDVTNAFGERNKLVGVRCGILGLGAVGYALARHLDELGAELVLADINQESLQKAEREFSNVKIVSPEDLHKQDMKVFAPCALGGGLNDKTIPEIKAKVICGAANNQLAERRHGKILHDKGIIYTPDYVVNAGGIIAVAYAYYAQIGKNPFGNEMTRENMIAKIEEIGDTTREICLRSREEDLPTNQIADKMAEDVFLK
ncbi:MAG: amino acid dehydrogenase [Alphaproteobacteria bacterium]|nr:amino acid dehydrogenase [Alphaproteobacteria bacterium]